MLQEMVCYILDRQKYSVYKKKRSVLFFIFLKIVLVYFTFMTNEEVTHIKTTANKARTPAQYLLRGWLCDSGMLCMIFCIDLFCDEPN
jgi:hypothetical protein